MSSEVLYIFLVLSAKTHILLDELIRAENCCCRNKHACPLQNKCMRKGIVYKATISIGNYTVREVLMKNRTSVWRNVYNTASA